MWILLVQLSKQDHNKNLGSASLSPSAQIRSSTFGTNSLAHAALVLYGFVAWKAGPDGLLDASLSVGLKFPPSLFAKVIHVDIKISRITSNRFTVTHLPRVFRV